MPARAATYSIMRRLHRFLAIVAIAAILGPCVRWAYVGAQLEACACSQSVCMCEGHHHGRGHAPTCAMANGGKCGLNSQDAYLASLLDTLNYVPTFYCWANPCANWGRATRAWNSDLLISHARIPEQPPRTHL